MKKLIKRFKIGGGTSPATPYNRGLSNPNTIPSMPEITVKGIDRRIRFDRRSRDFGNGYGITSDVLYDYYGGGNRYLGDLAYTLGGRTIYQTPKGNDTVFWKKPTDEVQFEHGWMLTGKRENGAKENFYNVIKKNKFIAGEPQEKAALQRAKRGYAEGGEIVKAEDGEKFLENLEPPSRGLWGEMKTNMQLGGEQLSKLFGSLPFQIALGGNAVGLAGMFGPEVRIFKDIRNMLGSSKGFKLGIRKFSRNLNAKKGDTSYRWTKTSGNLREGGFQDRIFPGMGKGPQRIVSKATRAEGSGYSAQPILNNNPVYQKASSPAQTSMQRSTNHMRSVPLEQTVSQHVFTRNRLIDEARDPWNYIFGHKNGGSLKNIPFHQFGGPLTNVDTRSDTTRQGYHEGTIPYGAGKTAVADSPMVLFDNPYVQGLLLAAGPLVKPKKLGAKTKETDINTELTLTKQLKASRNAYEVRKEDKLLHINKPIRTKDKYERSYDGMDARHANSGQNSIHNDYMKYIEGLIQKYPERKRYERIQMRILNATEPKFRKAAEKDLHDFLLLFKDKYGY